MSGTSRNFGIAQRERERRLAGLIDDPYDATAVDALADPAGNAFWGSLREQRDAANAAGLNYRVDLSGIGSPAASYGPRGGMDPNTAHTIAINEYLADAAQRKRLGDLGYRAALADTQMREAGASMARRDVDDRDRMDRFYTPPEQPQEISVGDGNRLIMRGGPRHPLEGLPGHLVPGAIAQAEKNAPAAGSFADVLQRTAQTMGKTTAQLTPREILDAKREYDSAGRTQDDNAPLETIIGPNGKPIRVRRQDAIGREPASGTMKPATGVEKRALNFFNRAENADKELEQLESQVQEMGLMSQGRLQWAPNFLQSQLGQSYGAAQRAFTEARLRKDSGAAIPEGEFENDRKTYFAQPGDSAQTLAQKRRGRAAILSSLAFESGQALGEFVGDSDEAKSIVERYKERASGKPAGTVKLRAPDGSTQDVPADQADHYIRLGAKRVGG